MSTDAH